MPKTKEEKREYLKQYYIKNKDKNNEKQKQYNEANKEKKRQYYIDNKEKLKQYYIENKEKINERNKKYREANKEKRNEKGYDKKYRETEKGKKRGIISSWIKMCKIKFDDRTQAEFYYNSYINTHRCTWCDKDFKDSKDRCMDHCHTCGLPRAIICRSCNNKDIVPCVNCLL